MKQVATTCAAASMPFKAVRMTVCISMRTSREVLAEAGCNSSGAPNLRSMICHYCLLSNGIIRLLDIFNYFLQYNTIRFFGFGGLCTSWPKDGGTKMAASGFVSAWRVPGGPQPHPPNTPLKAEIKYPISLLGVISSCRSPEFG